MSGKGKKLEHITRASVMGWPSLFDTLRTSGKSANTMKIV